MKPCSISISTTVDEVENIVKRKGELSLSLPITELFYQEEDGQVRILLQEDCVRIERIGEYGLKLFLKEGEESVGKIGINGQEGDIPVYCDRVAYSLGKDSLLVSLQYRLLLGKEEQSMKLRILAREEK